MKLSNLLLASLSAFVLLAWNSPANSAEKVSHTFTITLSDLDCPSCAKKLAAKLSEVEGVAKVETDVETQTAKITLKPKAVVTAKILWEAVEKAKKTPVKIEGPSGTVTEKPKT